MDYDMYGSSAAALQSIDDLPAFQVPPWKLGSTPASAMQGALQA
jgi:hypothetical protein